MLNGIWLLGVLLVSQAVGLVPAVPTAFGLYGPLVLWGGHILSPIVTAWTNPSFRPVMRQQAARFIVLPLAVLAGSVMLGTLGNPWFLMFLTFVVWNTWHFASQHFGVLSIYRRTGRRLAPRDRALDRYFTVVCGCILLPLAWFSSGSVDHLGPLVSRAGRTPGGLQLQSSVVALAAVLTLGYIAREFLTDGRSMPRVMYAVSIGLQPVFALVAGAIYSFTLVSISHWMIALALSARIISEQTAASYRRPWLRVLGGIGRSHVATMVVLLGLFLLSLMMHTLLMRPPAALSGSGWAVYFGYQLGDLPLPFAVLSGAYFGISFVHFLYDRFIYSFHRPEVRSAIAPHLFAPVNKAG